MPEVRFALYSLVFYGQLEVERGRVFGPVVGLRARCDLVTCGVNPGKLLTGIERCNVESISPIGLRLTLKDRWHCIGLASWCPRHAWRQTSLVPIPDFARIELLVRVY